MNRPDAVSGYGQVKINGRSRQAHRLVYEIMVGPVPDGLELDHLCRDRACWSWLHVEPVTHRVNVLRGVGITAQCARRTHCPAGHPYDAENTLYLPDGSRYCRTCHRTLGRAYRKANKGEISTQQRAYRNANRDAISAWQRAHREANRDKINAAKRARHTAHRDEINAVRRARRAARKAAASEAVSA